MNNKFEIAGKSVKDPAKHRNGDSFNYALSENEIVLLSLADGVGSKNCDWLASQTSCNRFIDSCKEELKQDYSLESLVKICSRIDLEIKDATDNCKGMMAVFSAIIWNTNFDFVHFINIGDTRIYKCSNGSTAQISTDETKDVIMRDKSGKLLTTGGSTIVRTGVTNALGTGNASIKVETCSFKEGEAIILASDGFYNCQPSFDSDIQKIIQSPEMANEIERVLFLYADYQTDDASLLILRRTDVDSNIKSRYKDFTNYDEFKNLIPKPSLIILLLDELKQNIVQKNKEVSLRILEIMNRDSILPSKMQLDDLLAACKANDFMDGQIYTKIVSLIRKLF